MASAAWRTASRCLPCSKQAGALLPAEKDNANCGYNGQNYVSTGLKHLTVATDDGKSPIAVAAKSHLR